MDCNVEILLLWVLNHTIQIIVVYGWVVSKHCADENLLVLRLGSEDFVSFLTDEGHLYRLNVQHSFDLDEV